MKTMIRSTAIVLLIICCCSPLSAKYSPTSSDYVLIVTSYNPDTKRMSGFINGFADALDAIEGKYNIRVENIACRDYNDSHDCIAKVASAIERNSGAGLKAVILLGQEAWASFLALPDPIDDVPCFACYASCNSILLTDSTDEEPQWIDSPTRSRRMGYCGGFLNFYNVQGNIELIRNIYCDTKHIALLTDNSFGGLSLQTYVKKVMSEQFADIDLILLDGHTDDIETIKKSIDQLPPNSVVLLGTWRIDVNGSYFVASTLGELFDDSKLPLFTLTGLGSETIAIGGLVPTYKVDAAEIAKQLEAYYQGNRTAVQFITVDNQYRFDKEALKRFSIAEYKLPNGSVINNPVETRLVRIRSIAVVVSVLLLAALIVTVLLIISTTRLRHYQKILVKEREQSKRSEQFKSAFLANISHELRTPLNSIMGFSKLLCYTDDKRRKSEYVDIIRANNDILLNDINDILDLSKIESGKIEFNNNEFDMTETIQKVTVALRNKVPAEVKLLVEAPYYRCRVVLDRARIEQIISNFILNAINYTHSGKIVAGYSAGKEYLHIYINDTGTGISQQNRDKLFGGLDKINDIGSATGVGLSLCQAIAEGYGGEIGIDSVAGIGSTFWVKIPCHPIIETKPNAEPIKVAVDSDASDPQTIDTTGKRTGKRILVAEDIDSNYLLVEAIAGKSYTIERAVNGIEAIAKARTGRYNLILMDIKMPLMDGLTATQRIREFNATIPIIAATAHAFDSDRENAIKMGCNSYIAKPIEANALMAIIKRWIDK